MNRFTKWKTGIKPALISVIKTKRRALSTALLSLLTFYILVLSGFPEYSYQMMSSGLSYWPRTFHALLSNMFRTVGPLSVGITALYSLFIGVALQHFTLQFRTGGTDMKSLASLSPGVLVTGCAGCGAGIIGYLGFFGAVSLLPMGGDFLKISGMLLLVYFLGVSGDPETCRLSYE